MIKAPLFQSLTISQENTPGHNVKNNPVLPKSDERDDLTGLFNH